MESNFLSSKQPLTLSCALTSPRPSFSSPKAFPSPLSAKRGVLRVPASLLRSSVTLPRTKSFTVRVTILVLVALLFSQAVFQFYFHLLYKMSLKQSRLHPQAAAFVMKRPLRDYSTLTVDQLRREGQDFKPAAFMDLGERECDIQEYVALSEGDGGEIPIRVYRPRLAPLSGGAILPALIYFHGGGWVLGSLDYVDIQARYISNAVSACVIAVQYRKAPEFKFPIPVLDSRDAARWVFTSAETLKIDRRRVAIGGESAGANLAAAVVLMLRDAGPSVIDQPIFQLLVYPVTNWDFSTDSYNAFGEGYGLTTGEMRFYWQQYLSREEDASDWRASPLLATSHAGLPPTMIIAGGCDILRDDAVQYADRLRKSSVPVVLRVYEGMPHGFFKQAKLLSTTRIALLKVAETLRIAFGGPDRQ